MLKKYIYNRLLLICFCFIAITNLQAQVVINEFSASNLNQYVDNHSDYEDWIELYNTGGSSVNLAGYYLSDDSLGNTKWQIPAGITIAANGFLRFWTSGRDTVEGINYHTNFKLKQCKNTPEYVVLSNSSGTIIDYHKLRPKTQLSHSVGRATNGSVTWGIFITPTPNASNNTSTAYADYADKPDFSVMAGFYTTTLSVAITNTDSNTVIRYTTDGTLPTAASTLYSSPITISTTKVLKAITISSNSTIRPSFIEFATYFINVTHSIPVVSVAGTQLDDLANDVNSALVPNGSFEYFDINKLRKANTYGQFNKHGQDSWVLSQRSLDFMSRDEMGYNHSIEEKLFTNSLRDNFQKIILRAAGDDNYPADHNAANEGSAHMRDAFIHNLADKGGLHVDVRRGAKCIVYLNGVYWGIYDLRENPDDHDFTGYYYGQDKFNLQYILTWGSTWAEYGGNQALTDWNTTYNYIMNNNMAVAANYQYVTDRFDVTSLVDYVLVNMFTVCSDWLNWNTGWWRGLDSSGSHLKWGYILWDNDATFGHYINYTGIPNTTPTADPCDPETLTNFGDLYQDAHISMLNKLRTNPDFNQYYISRQLDLWNTVFSCDNLLPQLDSTAGLLDLEMIQHAARWSGTFWEWETNYLNLRDFITQRCTSLTSGWISCYSLNGPYELNLNADPANAGSVKLNSLTIDQFPWKGNYFGGIDMKLEALPDTNSTFINWTAGSQVFVPNSVSANVKVNLSASDSIVAHFLQLVSVPEHRALTPDVSVYPAVFSDQITIKYQLPAAAPVTMKLFSLLGNEVATIITPGTFSGQGHYAATVNFSNTQLPAGMYLLTFYAGDYRKSVKLIYSPR